jgi:hypothetical protein
MAKEIISNNILSIEVLLGNMYGKTYYKATVYRHNSGVYYKKLEDEQQTLSNQIDVDDYVNILDYIRKDIRIEDWDHSYINPDNPDNKFWKVTIKTENSANKSCQIIVYEGKNAYPENWKKFAELFFPVSE